jgi:hypothetical protein
MHSRGIIHRDMKAANIILTSSGEVKLGAGRLTLDAALTPPHTHTRARAPSKLTLSGSGLWCVGVGEQDAGATKNIHWDAVLVRKRRVRTAVLMQLTPVAGGRDSARMAPEVIACDKDPKADYDAKVRHGHLAKTTGDDT